MYKKENGHIDFEKDELPTKETFERVLHHSIGSDVVIDDLLTSIGRARRNNDEWWDKIRKKVKDAGWMTDEQYLIYDWIDRDLQVRGKPED